MGMNYQAHYDRLISRAQSRKLEGYSERHHVIPRCLNGSNEADNLVELTAEEHLVAHEILVKLHPDNRKIIYAAFMMSMNIKNNKHYGWLHRAHGASVSAITGKNHPNWGKQCTPEHKAKVVASLMGNTRRKGIPHTDETKAKISAAIKAVPLINGLHYNTGKTRTPEAKAKMSASHIGGRRTEETKAKMADSRKAWWDKRKAVNE